METKIQKEEITLSLTRNETRVLNGFIGIVADHQPLSFILFKEMKKHNIPLTVSTDLLQKFADAVHDNDWCDDKDCLRDK